MTSATIDLPTSTSASTPTSIIGSRTMIVGIEQHAHRDEEQHGERILQRQ